MTGHQVLAFMNHSDDQMDMQPLWIGVLSWAAIAGVVVAISAIFG